jgi:hypothetical protein
LGEIFDGAFGAIRHNPAVMFGVSAITIAAATAIGAALSLLFVNGVNSVLADMDSTLGFSFAALYAMSIASTLVLVIAQPIASGLLAASVSRSVIGRKARLGEIWAQVRPRIGAIIGYSLAYLLGSVVLLGILIGGVILLAQVSTGAAVAGFVLLGIAVVVCGVWLMIRLLFVPTALVLEAGRLVPTVKRAWVLTRGTWWRVFGIYLLASIAVYILSSLLSTPLTLVATFMAINNPWLMVVLSAVAQVISGVITSVFIAGIVTLLYIDVRMRRF